MVTLANDQETLSTLNRDALPAELQLEYAKAKGDPLLFGDPLKGWWLLRGGNPEKGRAVVYNNPRSQCLRCHTISGTGGIAGPTLDGIADRLTERELQEALLAPNSDVADGFGEYSAMPPMGVLLDHVDLRDVIAYLKTLKAEQQLQTSP
jgi:cytochrome c553